jgi:phage terminase small subunit
MDIEQYGLTNQQQRFVEEYVIDLSAPKAAERSGYPKEMGTALLSRPQVQDAISDLSKELSESRVMSAQQAWENTSDLANSSMADIYDLSDPKNPRLKAIGDDVMKNVKEIELADGEVKKIKLYDRKDAQDMVNKMHGLYVRKHEHSGPNGKPIEVEHKYTDMEALVTKMDEMIEGNQKMKQAEIIEVEADVLDSTGAGGTDIE